MINILTTFMFNVFKDVLFIKKLKYEGFNKKRKTMSAFGRRSKIRETLTLTHYAVFGFFEISFSHCKISHPRQALYIFK